MRGAKKEGRRLLWSEEKERGGVVWLLATDLKTIASRRRGNFKHTSIDGPDGFCSSKSPEGGGTG